MMSRNSTCALCAQGAKPRLLIKIKFISARVSCFKLRRWILLRFLFPHQPVLLRTTLTLPSCQPVSVRLPKCHYRQPGSTKIQFTTYTQVLLRANFLQLPCSLHQVCIDAPRSSWYSILYVFVYLSRFTELEHCSGSITKEE